MTPIAIFGLAVRILGLIVLYRAIWVLPQLCIFLINASFFGSPIANLIDPMVGFLVYAAAAGWLLIGAPPVARLAYGSER